MSTHEEDVKRAMELMQNIDNMLQFFDMDTNMKIGDTITVKRPARFEVSAK